MNALNKEMQKFNGKISVGEDATTGSDVTSQTGLSKSKGAKSLKSNLEDPQSPTRLPQADESIMGFSPSPEKEHQAPRLNRKVLIKLEEGDTKNKVMDLEDEEEDKRAQEEEERKQREKSPLKELYREKNGQLFDPAKKFGIITPEKELIYDNITSSY